MLSSQSQPELKKNSLQGEKNLNFLPSQGKISAEQSYDEFKNLSKAFAQKNNVPSPAGEIGGNLYSDEFYFNMPRHRWFYLKSDGSVYTPRTGHTVSTFENYLYLFGGIDVDVIFF
jgi:hypothetical protein